MESEFQTKAFNLYRKLLEKGYLSRNHELTLDYCQEEKVRLIIHRLAKSFGTEVFESGDNLHLISLPEGSVFATSYSHAMEKSGTLDLVDWYIISLIQAIFCWEIDNDFSHRLTVEREGITYPQLEEMATKLFSDWKAIDDEKEGEFSEEFQIAVSRINNKWQNMSVKKPRVRYSLNSRIGLIHKAITLLKEGGLVHISESHKAATIVYPTAILYERLEYIFHNLDRYQLIKELINDQLEEMSLTRKEAKEMILNETKESEGTA